jgi:hypothetical protein
MLEQTRKRTDFAGWQSLEMTRSEEKDAKFLQRNFKYALRLCGFSDETVQNLTVGIEKASLTLTGDEKRGGAYHDHADGEAFFRMTLNAGTSLNKPNEALTTLLLVSRIFGDHGRAVLETGNPVTMTHDFRDALLTKATELTHIVHVAGPYIVKPAAKGPNPLSP